MARIRANVVAMALCCRMASSTGADTSWGFSTNSKDAVPVPTPAGMAGSTTTVTPWDSSVSSGSDAISGSSNPVSFNVGSLASDYSNSAGSSGSTASGSSGFFMQIWQWLFLAGVLCFSIAVIVVCCLKGRKKRPWKGKKDKKNRDMEPSSEPLRDGEAPQLEAPDYPLVPLATTSTEIPSWGVQGGGPMQYSQPSYGAPPGYGAQPQPGYGQPGYAQTYSTPLNYAPPMANYPPMAPSYGANPGMAAYGYPAPTPGGYAGSMPGGYPGGTYGGTPGGTYGGTPTGMSMPPQYGGTYGGTPPPYGGTYGGTYGSTPPPYGGYR